MCPHGGRLIRDFKQVQAGVKKARRSGLFAVHQNGADLAVYLHHHRHDQQRHDVDDLDQGIDRRAGGVLVGVTHGVAGHCSLVGLRAFAAMVSVLNVFLGVVPSTATGTHGNRHKQAGDDGTHQQAAQSSRA